MLEDRTGAPVRFTLLTQKGNTAREAGRAHCSPEGLRNETRSGL